MASIFARHLGELTVKLSGIVFFMDSCVNAMGKCMFPPIQHFQLINATLNCHIQTKIFIEQYTT